MSDARRWFGELLSALQLVHAQGEVHHDVKPENCLIGLDGSLRLIDFARHGASPAYAPPEFLAAGERHGPLMDMWACGVTLFQMLCGVLPWAATDKGTLLLEARKPLHFPPSLRLEHATDARSLVTALTHGTPSSRPTAAEALRYPFFQAAGAPDTAASTPPREATVADDASSTPPTPQQQQRRRSSAAESVGHAMAKLQMCSPYQMDEEEEEEEEGEDAMGWYCHR